MHPVYSKVNFGVHGVLVSFNNGSAQVNGYIVRQLGLSKYVVTDGTSTNGVLNTYTRTLAQTSAQVSGLSSTSSTYFTMFVSPLLSGASGATFTPSYSLDAATAQSIVSGGAGSGSSPVTFVTDGGVKAAGSITISNNGNITNGSTTITVASTTITIVASGATGNQINNGGTAAATAANLQTFLAAGTPNSIYSYVVGSTVFIYARATGTAGNSISLATNAATAVTVSGATLSGGVAAIAGTPSQMSITYSSGTPTGIASVSAAGAWATLPTTPTAVLGYDLGYGFAPITFNLKWALATGTSSITASGGSGYATTDYLTFSGFTAATLPTAQVSGVTGSAPNQVNVLTAGTGITVAGTIGVDGPVEHIKSLYDTQCTTVEGHKYFWSLGSSVDGASVVAKYS